MDRIGILGAGNLLLTDEGFGVHCIRRLVEQYRIPENVAVLDGGTAGIMLAPFMEEVESLYIFDCVNSEEPPGTIRCFSQEELRSASMHTSMSPHQLGLMEVLDLCRLRGKAPGDVKVITAVPADISTGMELSPQVAPAVDKAIGILRSLLEERGVVLKRKEAVTDA